jgi:hypothetical protein
MSTEETDALAGLRALLNEWAARALGGVRDGDASQRVAREREYRELRAVRMELLGQASAVTVAAP